MRELKKKHTLSRLSIADRKAILSLDSDALPPDPSQDEDAIDFSELGDHGFDLIVDRILGYRELDEIENARPEDTLLSKMGKAQWSNRSFDGYSSSYRNIKAIIKSSGLQDRGIFVDIGSSYGKVGCVVGANFPNVHFIGYEIVPERVAEAQRVAEYLQLDNVSYFHADVSEETFKFPAADWFFIYDSLNNESLNRILEKICTTKGDREIRLIAKYTGSQHKYSESPYLEFIAEAGKKEGGFGKCWLYRFK